MSENVCRYVMTAVAGFLMGFFFCIWGVSINEDRQIKSGFITNNHNIYRVIPMELK